MSGERRSPEDWNLHYAQGRPPWDLGAAPPALDALLATLPGGPLRVLVPGAGYGHDALAWSAAGHEVIAVDFAPLAVAGARQRAAERRLPIRVLQADVLDLPPRYAGYFDLVWEQTCLCALAPGQRAAYMREMARVLRDEGRFYGLLWNHGWEGGPPYDISPDLIVQLAPPHFRLQDWRWVTDSNSSRKNEFLVTLQKAV